MPYESKEATFFTGVTIVGRCSKWGSRTLHQPERIEFDVLCRSQRKHMFCARVTVYDPPAGLAVGRNDYVSVMGLPCAEKERIGIMAFGKDVKVLNKWISKKDKGEPTE